MTSDEALAMSIRARLQNLSTQSGEPFQRVMERYVMERFLFRLGQSDHAEAFILKGASLFWIWNRALHRPTRDIDMLRIGDASPEAIKLAIAEICTLPGNDALTFEIDSLTIEPIRGQTDFVGTRAVITARIGSAKLRLQIDIGVGDAVTPAPILASFPSLLEMDAPMIQCYPVETVLAEKLEAIVSLGAENSRMKDFFDVAFICDAFQIEGAVVT